jgi:serine phosphatase RsbU (regulator of sigma subunit)
MGKVASDLQVQAEQAAAAGDWKTAAQLYARSTEQRAAMLALINKVQEGLSSQLELQDIYTLVGDNLLQTFNAQVVMISEYDPITRRIFHQYGVERGRLLELQDWMPISATWDTIVRTRKPYMINMQDLMQLIGVGKMGVVPGTEIPKTWLGVPMLVGSTVRGMVCLQNLELENAFSQADIDLLMTITSSLTLSLENVRLFDRTERMLRHLRAEMDIARQTQRSILPARLPHKAGYQFGSLILPSRAVGGDFYDFIPLEEDKLGIVIGDVSDKGLPAALFMALTFSLLRAESERSFDPAEVLSHVNQTLLKMNASGMFVTLLYGILDYRTGVMQYARAGHLLPILLDGHGLPMPLRMGMGQPLGLFSKVELDEQEVALVPGGLLLFFTDGLNEAVDENGNQFGVERVVKLLQASRRETGKAICKHLWDAVKKHSRYSPNQDDFAVLVLKRASAGVKPVDLSKPIYW